MNRKIVAALAALIVVVALVFVATGRADGTPGTKVTICHATNAHNNPYTVNTVDSSSIDEEKNKYLNGHGDHLGPVWYAGIADHSWGDIIPPFTNPETGNSFAGYNWTEAGQAIYNNGCEPVVSTPTPTPTPTTTVTPTPTPTETPTVPTETPTVTPETPTETPATPETPVETPNEPEDETPVSTPQPPKNNPQPPKDVQVTECVDGVFVTTLNGEVIAESGSCDRATATSTVPVPAQEEGL